MAVIDFIEKRKISQLLNSGGYVLDFTNSSYQAFVCEKTGFDFYSKYGLSKGKNLEAIVSNEDNITVGKLLLELLRYMKAINMVDDSNRILFNECVQIGNKLIGRENKVSTPKEPQPKSQVAEICFNYKKYLDELIQLSNASDNPQSRGYEFEKYLNKLFKANNLEPRESFKIEGEQIDGSFVLRNIVYLLEAKWKSKPIDKADLVSFNSKVQSKSSNTRGLYISYSNYTTEAINTLSNGRIVNIILMTVQELAISFERNIMLSDILWKKARALDDEGKFYKSIMEL